MHISKPTIRRFLPAIVILLIIGFISFAIVHALARPETVAKGPNIVFVLIDCWRYDHCTPEITPNIWSLGQKGLKFDRYYVNAGWTLPSMAVAFSSQYPDFEEAQNLNITVRAPDKGSIGLSRFGGTARNDKNLETFPPKLATFPEVLKNAGYQTIGITQTTHTGRSAGYGKRQWNRLIELPGEGPESTPGTVVDEAIKQLRVRDHRKPYLLYLHLNNAHYAYNRSDLSEEDFKKLKEYVSTTDLQRRAELVPFAKEKYSAALTSIDAHLNRLFSEIDKEDTIIILTGDHGELFNEYGLVLHGDFLPEEIVHVPLVIAGNHMPDSDVSKLCEAVDLMPTILSLAGVAKNLDLAGKNIFSDSRPTMVIASSTHETTYITKDAVKRVPVQQEKTPEQVTKELKALGYLN